MARIYEIDKIVIEYYKWQNFVWTTKTPPKNSLVKMEGKKLSDKDWKAKSQSLKILTTHKKLNVIVKQL